MRDIIIKLLEENNTNKELIISDIGVYVDKLINNAIIIVHYEKSVIVGFCAFYANDIKTKKSFLTMICIDKKHQGFGIGSLLFKYWVNYVIKLNLKCCELEVKKNNLKAISLYKKNGFRINKETINSYFLLKEF